MTDISIYKREVDLDASEYGPQYTNSDDKLLQDDLNCYKFMQHLDPSDKDEDLEETNNNNEGTLSLDKPQ